jgi:4'-phosphopantetheinyl transferase
MLPTPGTAQVFMAHPERLLAAAPDHAAWLSAEERARADRYRRPVDRAGYLATRVLVRGILADALGRPPDALRFEESSHGKPFLHPAAAEGLAFSASRTPAWVTLVVTRGTACGIDVEPVHRPADVEAIARRFAPAERALLERTDPAERRRAFFQLWTLKEAFLKAHGTGLAVGLDACSFSLPAGAPPRASFAASLGEDPDTWSFLLLEPDPDHLLALALGTFPAPPLAVSGEAETCGKVQGMVGGRRPVR